MIITNCTTDHKFSPIGYAMSTPVFGWTVEEAQGKKQTAARILVYEHDFVSGDKKQIFDTDWKDLNSLGTPVPVDLKPRTRYLWQVCVRTDAGEEAAQEENHEN